MPGYKKKQTGGKGKFMGRPRKVGRPSKKASKGQKRRRSLTKRGQKSSSRK